MSVIKIRSDAGSPFQLALKEKIAKLFDGKPMTGNSKLFAKTGIIAIIAGFLYFMPYYLQIGLVWYLLISILKGAFMAMAGFDIGHDAIHGSYSNRTWVNTILGILSFDGSGVSSWYWSEKHNKIHHTDTNTEDDDDLNVGKLLRLGPWQIRLPIHRFQHRYALILYGFEHLHWALWNDFKRYFTHKIGEQKITRKMKFVDHVIFWVGKILFVTKSIVVPIMFLGWLEGLLGFFVMEYFTGLIISVVFQLAHAQNKSEFFTPDPITRRINLEWAVEQLRSTADFATDNAFVSWCVGGLNFQIVHHLFPRISHIHYKSIQPIVIQACKEFNLPYNHYDKFSDAVIDHFAFLKRRGRE
jgi:linoleoyl-CoA desaturase